MEDIFRMLCFILSVDPFLRSCVLTEIFGRGLELISIIFMECRRPAAFMEAPRRAGLISEAESNGEYFSTVRINSFKTERVGASPNRGPIVSLHSQINLGISSESCIFQANLMKLNDK